MAEAANSSDILYVGGKSIHYKLTDACVLFGGIFNTLKFNVR